MKRRKRTDFKLNNPLSILVFVLLIVYVISFLFPLIWSFYSTFKSYYEFRADFVGFPKKWVLENYEIAFSQFRLRVDDGLGFKYIGLPNMFLNSFLLSGGSALTLTLSHFLAAYATAKYPRYKLSQIITSAVLISMILPIVGTLPARLQLVRALGLYDSLWGSWIRGANFMTMYFLILQGTIRGVGTAYDEAAKIDGASNFRIMWQINFPLVSNMLKTIFLIQFIASWNDFGQSMVYLPSYPVVAYGLYILFNSTDNLVATITVKLSLTMLLFIPMLIVFMFFHKRLMGNLTLGGVKG